MDKMLAKPGDVSDEALKIFTSGLYCAESVLTAVARMNGREFPELPGLVTGLCSGMARTDQTCGALTGGILGLGLFLGRDVPEDPVDLCYMATQRLVTAFQEEWGSCSCHVLLECDLRTPEGQRRYKEAGLKMNRCAGLTAFAAAKTQEILLDLA